MIRTVGVIAGDAECYETFHDLFDPIIRKRHHGWKGGSAHPTDLNPKSLSTEPIDPSGQHVQGLRLRVQRNIGSLRMLPACTFEERREVERLIAKALGGLPEEFAGEYLPLQSSSSYPPMLGGMTSAQEDELIEAELFFQEPDAALVLSAGTGRHWPDARGVFVASSKSAAAWVNEEDHLRLCVIHGGDNLPEAFGKLCALESSVRSSLQSDGYDYSRSDALGFLTSCPSNLGCALHVNVLLSLPLLGAHDNFKKICRALTLQARTAFGPRFGPRSGTGVFDVWSSGRLGVSEVDLLNGVAAGCRRLVEMEATLARGEELPE